MLPIHSRIFAATLLVATSRLGAQATHTLRVTLGDSDQLVGVDLDTRKALTNIQFELRAGPKRIVIARKAK